MIEFITTLPTAVLVIGAILILGIVMTLLKKLVKFSLMLAALIILIIVITRLLQ